MGVHADLRAHRDLTAADDQPDGAPRRTTCPWRRRLSGCHEPGHRPSACRCRFPTRARCWPGRTSSSRATGSSPTRAAARSKAAGSTPATAASIDDDGYLTISDRKKDVIITGGENVSSIEVEDRLYQHPAVAEAAVIGVPDEKWGETIKAIVVLHPGQQVSAEELIAFCKEGLARYKAPTSVDIVEVMPRTATGKVQKFKLREPYWSGRDRQVN